MKNRSLFKIFSFIVFFLFSGNEALAAAGCTTNGLVPCTNDCTLCDMFQLASNIIMFVMTCLAPIIATLMIVWGGLILLISRGNPGEYTKAKKIIQAVIVGLAIMFLAWVFLNTLLTQIGVMDWTGLMDDPNTSTQGEGNWWQIECND